MSEQVLMFDVPPIKKSVSKLTAYNLRALSWYCSNYGLKVELSVPPQMNLSSKELGEAYPILLTDIVEEYKRWRKEETKRKAREKN